MTFTAGVACSDSNYTKAVLLDERGAIAGRAVRGTGFRLAEAARAAYEALTAAGVAESEVGYVIGTGYGRFQVTFADVHLEIRSHRRRARRLPPVPEDADGILDVGGQTMRRTRIDEGGAFVVQAERPHLRALVDARRLHRLAADVEDRPRPREQEAGAARGGGQIGHVHVGERHLEAAVAGPVT